MAQPFRYYPDLANVVGVKAALFFGYVAAQGIHHEPHSWFTKSTKTIKRETMLSKHEQRAARKLLRDWQLIEEKQVRLEHQMFFRVSPNATQFFSRLSMQT